MAALGGGIQGGQVIADWPGLGAAALDEGGLAMTIDYRDVLGEILERRLGADPSAVFPQHGVTV